MNRGRFGDKAHISVTSYNGIVLLTGEVPDEAARDAMAALARGTERVRGVQNELQVAPPSGLTERTNDTYLTSVTVTDNVVGVVGTIPGPVAPGATNYLYKTHGRY